MDMIRIDPTWVAQQVLEQLEKSQLDPDCPVRVYWPGEMDPVEENIWARVLDVAVEPGPMNQNAAEPDTAQVTVLVVVAVSDVALDPGSAGGSVLRAWQAARVIGWLLDRFAVNESADGTGHRLSMGRASWPQVGQVDEADPTKWALAIMARGTVDRVSGTEPVSLK